MIHSAFLLILLVAVGLIVGLVVAVFAERKRMTVGRGFTTTICLCLTTILVLNVAKFGSLGVDEILPLLLLSLVELLVSSVPSLLGLFVARKFLQNRGSRNAEAS